MSTRKDRTHQKRQKYVGAGVSLTPDQMSALDTAARARDRSRSSLLRLIVSEWLERALEADDE